MMPDTNKPRVKEKSQEELIAIIYELMAEIERLKGGGHKFAEFVATTVEHPLVDNPNKGIDVWAESYPKCQVNLLDQVPVRTILL